MPWPLQQILIVALGVGHGSPMLNAAQREATPASYRQQLSGLQSGDRLRLAAGVYERGMPLRGLHGTAQAPIIIEGPPQGEAVIHANTGANAVEIEDCSHLILRRLSIQGGGPSMAAGRFGISAKGGERNRVHDIRIEHCVIEGWNSSQQTVGISTKTPTWGWVISRNIIRNCGTGLYLGNSDGSDPFIGGVIEHNRIENPIGYCMEIKYQRARPALDGTPAGAQRTLIRHNLFLKNDQPSPDGDRCNLLVGGFPAEGPGSEDVYEIYGNVLRHNHRECLLQASGRVSLHDNVFEDCPNHAAIVLRDHDLPLRMAHVYHNTLVGVQRGIRMASLPAQGHAVVGNLILAAGEGLVLPAGANAAIGNVLARPEQGMGWFVDARKGDYHLRAGQGRGEALDLGMFANDVGSRLDFDGTPKGEARHRGAFAAEAKP